MYLVMKYIIMIKEMIEKIEFFFEQKVDEDSILYQCFVMYLWYVVSWLDLNEVFYFMDEEMFYFI